MTYAKLKCLIIYLCIKKWLMIHRISIKQANEKNFIYKEDFHR